MMTKTYTIYEHTFFYGGYFGNHRCYRTLREAWEAYKDHKAYRMADGGVLRRITMKKKLFRKPRTINEVDIINWNNWS